MQCRENEQIKINELKQSVKLKPEPNEINIDLRRSQTLIKSQQEVKDV